MSWLDKYQRDFTIITGDGKSYVVQWLNAVKTKEYFIAEFNYPRLAGSNVDRYQPKGRRYNIEIYIQGDDNLDVSADFETSCDFTNADGKLPPWTIQHPLYDNIVVQPVSLTFDNSDMNVTKITGQVIETITTINPITVSNPIDSIPIQKELLDEAFAATITQTPSATDISNMQANNNKLYNTTVPIITIPEQVQDYINLFNVAKSAINNATESPVVAMRATQRVISAPGSLQVSVQTRVNLLSNQFQSLRTQIYPKDTNAKIPISTKQTYQSQGGTMISTISVAASTPLDNDFTNINSVLEILELILFIYNQYLIDLDSIQTDNGGSPDSFIPDADALTVLNMIMNNTVANLFQLALTAQQERIIILDRDTNLIVLTHRLYGLDQFDNNINTLIANNGWGLNQMLFIPKNTTVKYYI